MKIKILLSFTALFLIAPTTHAQINKNDILLGGKHYVIRRMYRFPVLNTKICTQMSKLAKL